MSHGEMGRSTTPRTDQSVYLSPPHPPPLFPLPPPSLEASQTQMFYTAYEMFEGHRKRKSSRAWFSLSSEEHLPLASLCICMHSSSRWRAFGLVGPMYNQLRSLFVSKTCSRLYMSITGSLLLVYRTLSLQRKLYVQPYGQLLMNVESTLNYWLRFLWWPYENIWKLWTLSCNQLYMKGPFFVPSSSLA